MRDSWIEAAGSEAKAAALVAPAIRAKCSVGGVVHIGFNSDKSAIPGGNLIQIDASETNQIDDVYQKIDEIVVNGDELPLTVHMKGLGNFEVTRPDKAGTRLDGRVCLVTGGAQGFGEGIARELAAQGATIVIADLNDELAAQVAKTLCQQHGDRTAIAYPVNVGDEASVEQLINRLVLDFGGLDLLVSNAGILRAGGLEDMTLDQFELVTRINYTAFFLMTKYASRPMKIQARFDPGYYSDIVQINSKSGLEGSNRNFAYAGGKFGGIGLVQSFAKELVDNRIKVNAICPGNYYEGPLWSDPDRGLFVQYLNAGKVPGAKNVQDIYEFYIDKVPMRRGCSPKDVTRAILYCVEQEYETGQAIPVTGGQNMLK